MTREDGMSVANRCAGLALLVYAIVSIPGTVSAFWIYSASYGDLPVSGDIPGLHFSQTMASAGLVSLIHSLLQVFVPVIASIFFFRGSCKKD